MDIDDRAIEVFGKALDADGERWLMLADNDETTVPARVKGVKDHSLGLGHQKYPVSIKANRVKLDPRVVSGATFCVGEKIVFTVDGLPNRFAKDDVAIWSLPGVYVNRHPDSKGELFYDADPDLLTRKQERDETISTDCWYVKDKTELTVSVDVHFRRKKLGELFSANGSGKFKVFRPETSFDKFNQGVPTILVHNNCLTLGFENDRWMNFYHDINPRQFSGNAGYTQLVSGSYTERFTGLPVIIGGSTPDTELDNVKFEHGELDVPANTSTRVRFGDGPYVGLHAGSGSGTIDTSYETYLLFKPKGDGNIYVPLDLVKWDLKAQAAGGVKTAGSKCTGPGNTANSSSTAFPKWENIFSNIGL